MELARWKPQSVTIPFSSMIIASRRSGKSYLIKYLFQTYWAKKFDIVVVMCPTNFNGFYEEFIFGNFFFNELNEEFLERLLKGQQKRAEEGKKSRKILLILDDCSDDRERYNTLIQKLYTKGRHYNVSILYSTQSCTLTSNVWRNNSDFLIIGKQLGGNGRLNVIENFLVGNVDDDDIPDNLSEKSYMGALLRKYTADHSFVVLSYLNTTNDFNDTVMQYKVREKVKTVKRIKNKKVDDALITDLKIPDKEPEEEDTAK